MKYDIILAGVGGQGVLSVGSIIARAAMKAGYQVKQSEVHGMSQRGGAVLANLRISEQPIYADIIAAGSASMVLSMEPVESLRYIGYLAPDGILVSSKNPIENITDYPDLEEVFDQIRKLPAHRLVDSDALARDAGSMLATNMVMVGAASKDLPIDQSILEDSIKEVFQRKGDHVVEVNHKAFRSGREVG
ncbi:MAG: indolepyruvate oxidoreductase subunit beta [Spirochaetales bacterium]|jgi:indolepyruvate ferredoxin oxidoreductase, beta subunit|nr:indolepyruvate oxidoreductase subunit beta [Spirochaetales bacterium]